MTLLLALLLITDPSGVGLFLSDLEPGFPVPKALLSAPFGSRAPEDSEPFFRAGFSAGATRSFHCRGNGVTGGMALFTSGWFTPDRWGYTLESSGLFRFAVSVDSSVENVFLETAGGRLGLGFMGDSSGRLPAALWETQRFTGVTGPRGFGVGFSLEVIPGLLLGPAMTADGPWLKSSFSFRGLRVRTGPALNRNGGVSGTAVAALEGRQCLLAVIHSRDSTRFGGTARLGPRVEFGVTGPDLGCSIGFGAGALSLSGSVREGGNWCAGSGVNLAWGALSAWVARGGEWTLGLEMGRGASAMAGLLPGRCSIFVR